MSTERRTRALEPERLNVRVVALNDAGEKYVAYGSGDDTSEAVADAIAWIVSETGDDTYTMTDWSAA